MTLASRSKPRAGELDVLLAVLVTALATLLTLIAADWVRRRITERAHRVYLRFMGLFLVAIGAQLVLSGTREFYLG